MKSLPDYFRENIRRAFLEAAAIGSFLWFALVAMALIAPNPRSMASYMLAIAIGVVGLLLVVPLMGIVLGAMLVLVRWVRDRRQENPDAS
jgi:ABC-type transport system involved in cytochrome c biogenesis permease subunit